MDKKHYPLSVKAHMKRILTERSTLFDPNMYITFLFKIKGKPSIQAIQEAMMQAYTANEATMSKVVIGGDASASYQPLMHCGCSVKVEDEHWQNILKKNEKIPFRIEVGELVRTFIIPFEDHVLMLVMAHHLVGDGKSIQYLIEDFMRALAGEKLIKKPMLLFTKDSLSYICKPLILTRVYAKYLNSRWKRYARTFSIDDYYYLHNRYWKSHESKIFHERYTKSELLCLYQKAKERSLSINSLIIASFQKANSDFHYAGIAVDGRIDNNKIMSNQATGIRIKITSKQQESLYEHAQRVQKKVHKKLASLSSKYFVLHFISLLSPAFIDSILFYINGLTSNPITKKLANVLGYTNKKDTQLSFTNLKILNIPQQYREYRIEDMYFIPPVVSYGKRIIGVISDDNGMSIIYHFMNELHEETEIQFFNTANHNLHKLIKEVSDKE